MLLPDMGEDLAGTPDFAGRAVLQHQDEQLVLDLAVAIARKGVMAARQLGGQGAAIGGRLVKPPPVSLAIS
ncbi:hypothetical protein GCM10020258_44110 [Sphingomonas yabuuchiae]